MESILVLLLLGIPGAFVARWVMLRSRFRGLEQRLAALEVEVQQLRAARCPDCSHPLTAPGAPCATCPDCGSALPAPGAPCAHCAAKTTTALAAVYCSECGSALSAPGAPCAHCTATRCEWCGRSLSSGTEVCNCRTVPVPAGPSLGERLKARFGGEEWEAIVGGSLLNKLGVLILVIGLALLLGYSFTQMGPAGRAAIGLSVSFSMLIGGFFVERMERYRIFARGLLGGGWAALYFTTYAMYAIDATRVIDSPVAGTILLTAVAAGMIAHSLRYRSQSLTGLAYFIAFVTLAITPVTTLSVIALIPLAASLLWIAIRFDWIDMALFGLFATWGTLISRGSSDALAWQAETLFVAYWLLFEVFDLIRTARRKTSASAMAIMPLNAVAFAGLSYIKWSTSEPQSLALVAAGIGLAYLASALLRIRLRPPSSFEGESTLERIGAGGYEGPITVSAILSAAAVLWRFDGPAGTLGLIVEAQCLFLAGLRFGQPYLKQLAAALFGVQAAKMLVRDQDWTRPMAISAAVYYLNRWLDRPAPWYGYAGAAAGTLLIGIKAPTAWLGAIWIGVAAALYAFGLWKRLDDFRFQGYGVTAVGLGGNGWFRQTPSLGLSAVLLYGFVAAALRSSLDRMGEIEKLWVRTAGSWATTTLLAAVAYNVAPLQYLGLAWMVLALPLLELGLRGLPKNFREQAYTLGLLGACVVLFENIVPIRNDGPLPLRLIPAWSALAGFAFAARLYLAREAEYWLNYFSAAGTLFLCAGLWAVLPGAAAGPAWAAVALILVEAGLALRLRGIEVQGHTVAAAAFGRMWVANFTTTGTLGLLSHRLATVGPVAACFYHLWSRLGERKISRYYLWAGSILVFALMRFELGRTFTVMGWSAMALAVLWLGQRWKVADLRWQSYLIAGAAFVRAIATNFNAPESFAGAPGRWAAAAVVIGCLYAAQLVARMEKHARLYFSLLATALTTILLYHEVSGSMLTVAWGIEGIALLIAGFPLRDRVLRVSGLALFLVCILKLFLYDLRSLETPYRIASFIVLGLMMLAVSFIYTRFRDRIARYL